MTVDDKLKSWQLHYQKLLNVEFQWNASHLSHEPPKEGLQLRLLKRSLKQSTKKGLTKLLDSQVLS